MWNIILDGLFILNEYKAGIFTFLGCVFLLGFFQIKQFTNNKLDIKISLFISFGVGSISLCLLSYIIVLFSYFWPPILQLGSLAVLLLAGFIFLKLLLSNELKIFVNYQLMMASMGLLFLLIIRLAYLKHIILPPYSDSPIHYQIILGLLNPNVNYNLKLSLENIFINYYHFGFHSLVVWLVSAAKLDPLVVIPLFGQLFLVLAPISVIALTYAATNNLNGALFSGLLAAIGWIMPAFSANWGKYPALAAIAMLPIVFVIPWLYQYGNGRKSVFIFYNLMLAAGVVLIHSRIFVCLLLGAVSYFFANKLKFKDELSFFQSARFSLLFVISLWPLLQLIMEFYKETPVWIIILTLLPFAFQFYPRVTAGVFFYVFGLWLVALVPNLLKINIPPLLDRQFLEMMLYIPFSVIGGLGFSGLTKKLELNNGLMRIVIAVIAGIMILNFPQSNLFLPDSCCNYFGKNDQLAFHWILKNKSAQTLFITSTFYNNDKTYGTDAGIWIYPLTKIAVNKLPFNTKWNSAKSIGEICQFGSNRTYIYAGQGDFSFDKSQLEKEAWLHIVFQAGKTAIYQVDGCNK